MSPHLAAESRSLLFRSYREPLKTGERAGFTSGQQVCYSVFFAKIPAFCPDAESLRCAAIFSSRADCMGNSMAFQPGFGQMGPVWSKRMKHKVKRIHFVGVGGAGMSGIAEVLCNLGFRGQWFGYRGRAL